MPRSLIWIAVVLPIVTVAAGIAASEHRLLRSETWYFRVQGYDPRDVLRGHYVQFQLQYEEGPPLEACEDMEGDCCLCLTRVARRTPPTVRRARCDTAARRCDGRLRTRDLPELRRYFIPERNRHEIEKRLREAAAEGRAMLEISIDGQGRPQVRALLVDGNALP